MYVTKHMLALIAIFNIVTQPNLILLTHHLNKNIIITLQNICIKFAQLTTFKTYFIYSILNFKLLKYI